MSEWFNIITAPYREVIKTKIDDDKGARNEGALYRDGNLWWVPDGSMYVYYRPTHWRHLTDAERNEEVTRLNAKLANARDQHTRALGRL